MKNVTVAPDDETAAFDTFLKKLFIDPSTISQDVFDTINKLYPANDSSLGGAFNTGDSLFDRAEAWYTDNQYLSPRRLLFHKAAPLQPLFAYFFKEFIPGQDPTNGGTYVLLRSLSHTELIRCTVFHASELILLFGQAPAVEQDFASQMADFYVNFISDLHPGGDLQSYRVYPPRLTLSSLSAPWPQYELATKSVLQLMRDNITAIPDGTHHLHLPVCSVTDPEE